MLKKDQHIIGIFVDYHNLMISLRKFFTLPYPDISLIKNYAEGLGKIVILKVFADWNLFYKYKKNLKTIEGVKLVHEPHLKTSNGKLKELLDTRMAFDIGSCLERSPEIDMYILATGDADFIAVVKQLQIRGKKVLIIAEQNSLSHHLKKSATRIITYQELVESYLKTSTKDSKISLFLPSKMEEGVVVYEKY